ncbi:penicillin-binding protein 1A [Thiocapsa marina]|uniref:Penicillin-binding protein 1A n=1 Tax=Thiocapsa marina 5811 TaxID=768671 RepID=F9UFP5_9GAMM|nr:penicillin-binding protein 1A [Thiocapsa marina]EGV16919.1 penicillin-binding protein, 1A family [Thiocapsa marina 5811]
MLDSGARLGLEGDLRSDPPHAPPRDGKRSARAARTKHRGDRRVARRRRSVFGWFTGFLAVLGAPLQLLALGLLGAGVFVSVHAPELPSVESLTQVQFEEPLRVYSSDGGLIAEFGVERRRPVAYEDIPPLVINAFLATEDARFFEHGGVDAIGIGRALLSFVSTGTKAQGGSTITMQVTRNFLLSSEKTFQRKLAEVLLTLQVERTLTKDQILDLYLNQIFFGHRAYGISAAAALYYDKDLDALTPAEAAMLAGIPKAPSSNNPVTNPERALERRNYILSRMLELGQIDREEYEIAVLTPDMARLHRRQPDLDAGYIAEMARQTVVQHYGEEALSQGLRVTTTVDSRLQSAAQAAVRRALRDYDRRHGYRGAEAKIDLDGATEADMDAYLESVIGIPDLTPGLVTRASAGEAEVYIGSGRRVELGLKQVAWAQEFRNANWRGPRPRRVTDVLAVGDLVRLHNEGPGKDGEGRWELGQLPSVAGALVSIAPQDGAVRALVGGYSFNASKFNRAVDMRRQPGSSFKPFVYAAALHEGWTPASLIKDETVKLIGEQDWNPRNSDRKEMGPIRMRRALALSRNLAAINLLQSVGLEDAQNYIRAFGFDLDAMPLGLSMALGTGEMSPMKLAEGYAVFANGGYHVTPYFIQRIETGDGRILFESRAPRSCSECWYRYGDEPALVQGTQTGADAPQVIDPRIAYQITSLLREVVEAGTGTRAKKLKREDIVGKTGTTNDVRDSWFAGYQADFVTIAWMGFDDFEKLGRGEEGGRAALGMWVDFMGTALENLPIAQLDPPPGMVQVRVDPTRGTETKAKSGILEMVNEEFSNALLGPEPVRVAGPTRKADTSVRRSAPRVMDDLF